MNYAKSVESLRQASEINLLALDGNPKGFGQRDAGDFAERGLN